ncbi:hypothetical protein MVES_003529 [Malassezia vespertilionis]|uniref:Peptidase S26 domain-containing protein n=1 Tax=Malassezia vespertilionis TaxID=2020962 RepID=A0A2N1J7N9_9BASI|nr:hypothetical protein MVES_003529 [Malassezia vespertilionis]
MAVHAGRIGIFSVQVMCLVHLVNQYMFEVRVCKGASMLPTLSPQGDLVLHMRSPFLRLLALTPLASSDLKERFSTKLLPRKMDSSAGTGLRMGDIVVALSPTDPSRTVCKRILGMPGDTVLVDPRQGHTDDDDLAFAASAIPELLQAPW